MYDTSAMGALANYIDYEAYGRDVRLEQGGVYAQQGYIALIGSVAETYVDREDIPDEYRLLGATSSNEQERSFSVGDYKVDVQLNSDNDFDYTIYKNGKHLDGGVLENEKGLDTIPDSVFDEIKKMHELEAQQPNNKVYGYVYDDNGMHGGKIPFEGTPENMAPANEPKSQTTTQAVRAQASPMKSPISGNRTGKSSGISFGSGRNGRGRPVASVHTAESFSSVLLFTFGLLFFVFRRGW